MNIVKNMKIFPTLSVIFSLSCFLSASAQVYNADTLCLDKYRTQNDTLLRCEDRNDPENRETGDLSFRPCAGGSQSLPDVYFHTDQTVENQTGTKEKGQVAETSSRQVNSPKTVQKQKGNPQEQKHQEKGPSKEDVEVQKIAYFTKELELTSEEAAKFWPLYYQSWEERTNARKATMRDLKKLNDALKADPPKSQEEIKQLADAYLKSYGNEYALVPKYFTKFNQVLPLRKTAKIFQAEENFRVMLIRQLRNHNH